MEIVVVQVTACFANNFVIMVTVARGRNIFGDPSSHIQELTAVIKQVSDHLSTMKLQSALAHWC